MQQLIGPMRAAIERYALIEPGDRIAVGVSGGKDSLALLCALAKLQRFLPQRFTLAAVTVDPAFSGEPGDYRAVEALCASLGVPYRIRRSSLGTLIFEERKEKNPCSLCARMRRGMLHDEAKALGCNKLALGHHLDDAVETFWMNLLYGGQLACFSPKTYLSRKDLTVIRPMVFCTEREVRAAAARENLPVVKSRCPADGASSRQAVKEWAAEMEKTYPGLRDRVAGAMERAHLSGW